MPSQFEPVPNAPEFVPWPVISPVAKRLVEMVVWHQLEYGYRVRVRDRAAPEMGTTANYPGACPSTRTARQYALGSFSPYAAATLNDLQPRGKHDPVQSAFVIESLSASVRSDRKQGTLWQEHNRLSGNGRQLNDASVNSSFVSANPSGSDPLTGVRIALPSEK